MTLVQDGKFVFVDEHARKAHASQYDRKVAIAAIEGVRETIQTVAIDLAPDDYADQVMEQL